MQLQGPFKIMEKEIEETKGQMGKHASAPSEHLVVKDRIFALAQPAAAHKATQERLESEAEGKAERLAQQAVADKAKQVQLEREAQEKRLAQQAADEKAMQEMRERMRLSRLTLERLDREVAEQAEDEDFVQQAAAEKVTSL